MGLGVGDVHAIHDEPAVGRFDETIDHLQGGGLAAARRPHQHDDLPAGDLQREILDRRALHAGERLCDVVQTDHDVRHDEALLRLETTLGALESQRRGRAEPQGFVDHEAAGLLVRWAQR